MICTFHNTFIGKNVPKRLYDKTRTKTSIRYAKGNDREKSERKNARRDLEREREIRERESEREIEREVKGIER
jgi:hypothetical protein